MNHTRLHRTAKWLWLALIPLSYYWRNSVVWVVLMSHYAILVSHWAAEEAADEQG